MNKPIGAIQKTTASHPILWGSLVFLFGSGCELLLTQKLLGTRILSIIVTKTGLIPQGKTQSFFYHTLTLYLGLLILSLTVHLIARTMKGKGTYLKFLSLLFFITGIVSLVSTIVTLIVHDHPAMTWLSLAVSLLSFVLFVGVIREIYKLPLARAAMAGGIPVLVTCLFALT